VTRPAVEAQPSIGRAESRLAPGWASDSWIKWLTRIELLDHDFDGFWMKSAYRHPAERVAPGTAVDPKDMIPVTDLNVKSVIASPGEWAAPGAIAVQGVAWSNASPVIKVEISADGGKTWSHADLPGKPTKYGFRKFAYHRRRPEPDSQRPGTGCGCPRKADRRNDK